MGAMNDRRRSETPRSDRRRLRSACLADALRLQLDACRRDEGLAAIVVSDELGFCVAHSGGDGAHEELAAQLPMLADPARRSRNPYDDEPLQPSPQSLVVATFFIEGATLHACAVAAPPPAAGRHRNSGGAAAGRAVLERVASGFSRLLAQ
jgi:hypothetical protein